MSVDRATASSASSYTQTRRMTWIASLSPGVILSSEWYSRPNRALNSSDLPAPIAPASTSTPSALHPGS